MTLNFFFHHLLLRLSHKRNIFEMPLKLKTFQYNYYFQFQVKNYF